MKGEEVMYGLIAYVLLVALGSMGAFVFVVRLERYSKRVMSYSMAILAVLLAGAPILLQVWKPYMEGFIYLICDLTFISYEVIRSMIYLILVVDGIVLSRIVHRATRRSDRIPDNIGIPVTGNLRNAR